MSLTALTLRLLLVGLAVQPATVLAAGNGSVHAIEMSASGGCKACDHQVQASQCVAACVATHAILAVAGSMTLPRAAPVWPLTDTDMHGRDPPPELAPPRAQTA